MSGDAIFPSGWEEEDAATGGEMIARSKCCNAPLRMTLGDTIIQTRCSGCARLVDYYSVFAAGWHGEA